MASGYAAEPATIVCEEPVDFEYRGGLVYVTDPALGCVRVFRPHTFYRCFHNAARCVQECNGAETATVIEFPGIAAHD